VISVNFSTEVEATLSEEAFSEVFPQDTMVAHSIDINKNFL